MPEDKKMEVGQIIFFKDPIEIDDYDLDHNLSFLKTIIKNDKDKKRPRRYKIIAEAGAGKKGIGYKCVLLDGTGNPLKDDISNTPIHFFVKIPTEGGQYRSDKRLIYMNSLKEAVIKEGLTWGKLRDIPQFANVGFDRCVRDYNGMPFPMTAQRFLSEGKTLSETIKYTDANFKEIGEGKFLRYALLLAELIVKIHNRRVIHGDIHPGNIFVATKEEPWRSDSQNADEYFMLIDFGAAIFEQGNVGTVNFNHEFRAPERNPQRASYVISESVDVYSFGKILYVLATGLSEQKAVIEDGYEDNRDRRAYIRRHLKSPYLENPCYLDLLSACCSFDPINRPSMIQIVSYLKRLNKDGMFINEHTIFPDLIPFKRLIGDMTAQSDQIFNELDDVTKNLFEMLAREKVEETMNMFSDKPTTQAVIKGTRWDVINSLTMLFDQMKDGDSWTTLTTPEVWQGNGLGLDGRYLSSNIWALRRGASIRRFMALSVDQLGTDWSKQLAESLKMSASNDLKKLGEHLSEAVGETRVRFVQKLSDKYCEKYRKMFYDYICAWRDAIDTHTLGDSVSHHLFAEKGDKSEASFLEAKRLHIGLLVFEDIDCLSESKSANTHSILVLQDKIFHVITEMRGRLPRNIDKDGFEESLKEPPTPHLVGFRLFQSVQPERSTDRMIQFYDLVHRDKEHKWRSAVNIGPAIAELCTEVKRILIFNR